jgi:hypothetical protein
MKQILTIALLIVACFFCADAYCGIHVFTGAVQGDMWIYRIVRPGIVILHTDLNTGKATWLICTGTFEVPTRRISFSVSRLLGVFQTETHIAAALYNAERIWDHLPNEPPPDQGTYSVSVFEKKHGKKSFDIELNLSAGRPAFVPDETTSLGIIEKTEDGFSVLGNTFTVHADGSIARKDSQ